MKIVPQLRDGSCWKNTTEATAALSRFLAQNPFASEYDWEVKHVADIVVVKAWSEYHTRLVGFLNV